MITITQDKIFKSDFSIINSKKPQELETISENDIVKYLSDDVELGESVNFERLFDIISENMADFQKIYNSCLGGYSLAPFLDEVNDIPTKKTEILFLELFWFVDKFEDELTIASGLHGIGLEDSDNSPYEKGSFVPYAIEFTPLNNIKYLKVRLNKNLNLTDFDRNTKEVTQIDMGNQLFKLFDLFYAILYEISWNGHPEQRSERIDELEESIEHANEEFEEGKSIEIDDDFFEELDKNDIYLVKYKDIRDRLDEEYCEGIDNLEPLKNCLLQKLKIYDEIEKSNDDLTKYDKKLSDVEFNLQLLYGLDEDYKFHRFWETPKCTCPKIDNVVKFPLGDYIKDENCPIHGTKKEKI